MVSDYRSGKIMTKDVKNMLADELIKFTKDFQKKLKKVKLKDIDKNILKNKD